LANPTNFFSNLSTDLKKKKEARKYHRRRSSDNFRGHDIFARKIWMKNYQNARILHDSCPKNYENTRIFMIFGRKINKIPEYYVIFARKMPEFYIIINCPKKYFSRFFGGCPRPSPLALKLCRK